MLNVLVIPESPRTLLGPSVHIGRTFVVPAPVTVPVAVLSTHSTPVPVELNT